MKEKTLEEQADELLRELCHSECKSMRELGMIDARRQRTISAREFPLTDRASVRAQHGLSDDEED